PARSSNSTTCTTGRPPILTASTGRPLRAANGTIVRQKSRPDLAQRPFRGQKLRQSFPGTRSAATKVTYRAWSVAVEVGFEPTEDLRLHTLSSTAHHRSPPSITVPDQCGQAARGRW